MPRREEGEIFLKGYSLYSISIVSCVKCLTHQRNMVLVKVQRGAEDRSYDPESHSCLASDRSLHYHCSLGDDRRGNLDCSLADASSSRRLPKKPSEREG